MTCTSLIIIFSGIGVLALVSIFFGIVNWIGLASTTSTINKLQTEIEKKYDEIDSRGKEGTASVPYPASVSPSPDQSDILVQAPQPQANVPQAAKEPQIEIVRNVRGGYVVQEDQNMTQQTIPVQGMNAAKPLDTAQTVLPSQPGMQSQAPPYHEPAASSASSSPPPARPSEDDVLEFVDTPPVDAPPLQAEMNSVTIPLYSKASQDADFDTLWQTLKQYLESSTHYHIKIDFKNILFLYEKELEYLHKIHKAVTHQQCKFSLTQCSPELVDLISKDPQLQNLIEKES